MKNLIIASAILLSIGAINLFSSKDRTKQFNDLALVPATHTDTVPGDTTKKDTTGIGLLSYNVADTVPSDTAKKDTARKDTMFLSSLAFNVRDTVPTDTVRKDSSFQYFAFAR